MTSLFQDIWKYYYSYDFENPDNHNRPNFKYSQIGIMKLLLHAAGFIKTTYQTDKARANLAVAVGTYMNE